MSKRSIRLVAGIAGAAMALGSMAPAMADRVGGDDVDVSQLSPACITDLADDLFPLNIDVNPENPTRGFINTPLPGSPDSFEGGLVDVAFNDNDNTQSFAELLTGQNAHLGVLDFDGTLTYGVAASLAYVLGNVVEAGQCLTEDIVNCVIDAVQDLTPVNVDLNPEHPFRETIDTGAPAGDDSWEGGLLDVALNDNDNIQSFDEIADNENAHLGVFGPGPLGIYGIGNTLAYVGDVTGALVTCLNLPIGGPGGLPLGCLGGVDVFPLNVGVDPFRLFRNFPGLLDVALGDNDSGSEDDGEAYDGFHIGALGRLLYTHDDQLGGTLGCILRGGDDGEGGFLAGVTGMTGLGGSPLSVLGGGSPLSMLGGGSPLSLLSPVTSTVFSLTSSVTGTLGLGILGGGGGLGLDASLLASVAAIL